jgi:hypothetical protein
MSITKFTECVTDYCPTPVAMGWSSARRLQELGFFLVLFYYFAELTCFVAFC